MTGHSRKWIPEQYHTVTPSLCVKGAAKDIEFYKKAFDAIELNRFQMPDGRIGHADLKIGDSIIFITDEFPEMQCNSPKTVGKATGSLFLYVEDADAAFNKAVSAGATARMPVSDMFWGDRFGSVVDPFGHHWGLATHVKDMTPDEIRKASEKFHAQAARK